MKGRRPDGAGAVVPMREDGAAPHNLEERARARMLELEPEDLNPDHREIYRRLALPLCHPTRDRLNEANAFMFHQLVRVVARHEKLLIAIEDGETYTTKTRDGEQQKTRPEVAQVNETFRQIRALAGEFGMTPATERSLSAGGQLGFQFPDAGGYLT
ncbi:P27 family phage terminase small subunit [Defluviimonas sp. D31]|uniref:P27 family phage terminase small subunit n=1 Tax=Defluviimonas sp. D31 TaxID=3083253 RepID=UPI00296E3AB6|nr:P27 family phage terminase small subunit [Defluviimonas sp. D31]MDW4550873.1 P27 family phage terminase small subunit [Defluviimonas sp. D31]